MATDVPTHVVKDLISKSVAMKEMSYCPYSKFRVGAALLCKDGTIFTGCNVENACFTPSICAERAAFAKAVSEGYRKFRAITIASDMKSSFVFPCGVCRQTMAEFSNDMDIYITKPDGSYQKHNISELLPGSFTQDSLLGEERVAVPESNPA